MVIIDEFDRIGTEAVKRESADTIKMLSDYQARATLVLVGVADSVVELIQEHQSIERALLQIHMPRMDREELEEIINNGLERLTMTIDTRTLNEIVSLAKGLPYFVHLLGLHAARRALDAGEKKVTQNTYRRRSKKRSKERNRQCAPLITGPLYRCAKKPFISMFSWVALWGKPTAGSVVEPISIIRKKPYQLPYFAQHLKDFSGEKRGKILQQIGEPHNRRYRFRNPMMQPFVIMNGLSDGLIDARTLEKFGHFGAHFHCALAEWALGQPRKEIGHQPFQRRFDLRTVRALGVEIRAQPFSQGTCQSGSLPRLPAALPPLPLPRSPRSPRTGPPVRRQACSPTSPHRGVRGSIPTGTGAGCTTSSQSRARDSSFWCIEPASRIGHHAGDQAYVGISGVRLGRQ